MLLGTFVFHSRVWAEDELKEQQQQSLLLVNAVNAHGDGVDGDEDGLTILHGTQQPLGMIAALRKQLKSICMHEWIAQQNTNNSINNIQHDNSSISSSSDPNEETNTNTNTSTHLCMKIKADKVIGNASSATSTLAAAVVDATNLNSVNSLTPRSTLTPPNAASTPSAPSQISQSNLSESSQIDNSTSN